jgi:hypothetical protein
MNARNSDQAKAFSGRQKPAPAIKTAEGEAPVSGSASQEKPSASSGAVFDDDPVDYHFLGSVSAA